MKIAVIFVKNNFKYNYRYDFVSALYFVRQNIPTKNEILR